MVPDPKDIGSVTTRERRGDHQLTGRIGTVALLHYRNLDVHRPDILMCRAVRGLQPFYDFLTRAKNYMESDAAVKRLKWLPAEPSSDDGQNETTEGTWIRLTEPDDRPNEPEATFRGFLDEESREVYEWRPMDGQPEDSRRKSNRDRFSREHCIKVRDRHPDTQQLLLERRPVGDSQLLLRPNTWTVECQRRALRVLQDSPRPDHLPLLRLFERLDHTRWESVSPEAIDESEWTMLCDAGRPGTEEQRRFVETALGTPDFAFLEGPPGSGKTMAICELILQLAMRGKRVLLCASTHVAVDNVLERLMDEGNPHQDRVIPVRIGDRRNVSEQARPWQIEKFVKTERERLLGGLRRLDTLTLSQETLRDALRAGGTVIERMVLDAANLVCGTTIGILQHPDIKKRGKERRGADPEFDVLVVDEASKTPFQEFLVPALWAKRWVIVGDPKQLSPYVDEDAMAVNVEACLPKKYIRDACIDAFMAGRMGGRRRRVAAAAVSEGAKRAYTAQCEKWVNIADADRANETNKLWSAAVIVGSRDSLRLRTDELPLDIATVRCADGELPTLRRRADAWLRLSGQDREEQPEWAREVGWRLARLYEQRFSENDSESGGGHRKTTTRRLEGEIKYLLPVEETGQDPKRVWRGIDNVRRIALPSVLESLQHGFGRNDRQGFDTALSNGLPLDAFEKRHVLLSTQHRMHPDIAAFSHDHIYDGEALETPEYMADERRWSYSRYDHRAEWIDVRGAFHNNCNEKEACQVIEELCRFDEWARNNSKNGAFPWEVAVLSFYRGQEREIRAHLRRWTEMSSAMRHFRRGPKERPHIVIELCTVDRFQGHEADVVLISFANRRPTNFLESPNRLNVALTRARYQRVIVGDRQAMRKSGGSLLGKLAGNKLWGRPVR